VSVVPPNLGWLKQKTCCDAQQEEKASLTRCGYGEIAYTLCPDNGGNSGAGYSAFFSPCNSEVHSALRFGQVFTVPLLSDPSWRRVLVLVTVFWY
jgi:hypothetical protein